MATLEQIVAYIRQHAAKYPLAALRGQLLKQGLPQALVDQAIQVVSGGQKPPVTQPPATASPGAQPPATRPPVPATQPPITVRPPATTPTGTQPPAAKPVTQPLAATPPPPTRPPATQPPATQPPITARPPATTPPGTQPPTPGPIGKPGTAGQDVLHTPAAQGPAAAPPAQPKPAIPAGYIPPKAAPVQPPAGRSFILVVDDDQLIRDMLVSKLDAAGYRVTSAEDAAQSVIQAEGMRLALIISDIEMPGFGTGVDALKKLRASNFIKRNLPVIFVTGMPPQDARRIVPLTDPYVRLMHKPVDWNLLRLYIRDLTGMDKAL
ncbi:MAG: response regulator [Elusimicrobiota bacterium]